MGGHHIVPLITVGYFCLVAFRFTQFIEAEPLGIRLQFRSGFKFRNQRCIQTRIQLDIGL